jgi:glucokinase
MKKVTVGIDIGGTNTAIGVVDQDGKVMAKNTINTPKHGQVDQFINDIVGSIKALENKASEQNGNIELAGIGIGAPNGNYHNGTIEQPPNLSFKGITPFVELLRNHFDMKAIALTNDANAAAIGEMVYGGARGMENFAMFTLGTGVGSGLVVNGDLVYGHDGFAGECGHMVIVPDGRICGCGGRGHLEAYCSAPGMKRTAFELLAEYNNTDSPLADKSFSELDSRMIYEAAIQGDEIARQVFEITGKLLGIGLSITVNHLSPEAIFLFGGPSAAGDLIFTPTRESMEKHILPIFRNKVKLLPSELDSGDAAIVGGSALAWKELEKVGE